MWTGNGGPEYVHAVLTGFDMTILRAYYDPALRSGMTRGQVVAALPGILSGLRVSLAIGIILLVAAEMLGAEYGIGAYILQAGALYDLERLFAGVVILSALGVVTSWAIGRLETRLLRWRS